MRNAMLILTATCGVLLAGCTGTTTPYAPNTAFGSTTAPITSGPNGGPGIQEGSGASSNR